MKVSSTAIALATTVLFVSLVLAGSRAQQTGPAGPPAAATSTRAKTPEVLDRDPPNRRLLKSGGFVAVRRKRGPNDPKWKPGPVPEAIPVSVSGQARDEEGKPVPRAQVFLFTTGILEPKLVAQATADEEGRYSIEGGWLAVVREYPGKTPLPKEITPYASFAVCGTAPGRGLAWSDRHSIYALAEPRPDDIQGLLPLGQPVELDLTFPRAANLAGRVVDEAGEPVAGAKVQVLGADLLDAAGRETNNTLHNVWKVLPGSIGFAATDDAGRFAMDRLPDRACYRLIVTRPETDHTTVALNAATIDGPDTSHGELPLGAFNGREPHKVRTGDIVITFPRIRRIALSVVADDTHRPVAGIRVWTLADDLQTGIHSGSISDRDGRLILGLPPGQYPGICADPPVESNYLRTYQRPLVVRRGDGDQAHQLVLNSGCEVQVRVTEAGTSKPVAGVVFWRFPVEHPDQLAHLRSSTSRIGDLRTDESGMGRAVLPPEPGRRYRLRFAGIHEPNTPQWINPEAAKTRGYTADPAESRSIELVGGKTIRLWFVLHKPGEAGK
jgi:hypothetical protein